MSEIQKLTISDEIEMGRLYNSGMNSMKIGKRFKIDNKTVIKKLRLRGVTIRKNLGAKNLLRANRGTTRYRPACSRVQRAIKKNILIRPDTCEKCGITPPLKKNGVAGIDAHHCDYNKPLEVMWLCISCHQIWHMENRAIPFQARADVRKGAE